MKYSHELVSEGSERKTLSTRNGKTVTPVHNNVSIRTNFRYKLLWVFFFYVKS